MKLLTKEEEEDHYNVVFNAGVKGGIIGLGVGLVGVTLLSRRFPTFRMTNIPTKGFIVSSAGLAGLATAGENATVAYGKARDPMNFYKDESQRLAEMAIKDEDTMTRLRQWGQENRYKIVFGSWVASISTAFWIVNRDKYMTAAQKVVQARVYAQGLTVAVMIATAFLETKDAREGKGHWETIKIIDPEDPEHKRVIEKKIHKEEYAGQDLWKDMVAAEERRIETRKKQHEAELASTTPQKQQA